MKNETTVNESIAQNQSTDVAVVSNDNFFEAIPALRNLSAAKKIEALRMVTSYQGAPATKVDDWINKEMPVCGVAIHAATISQEVKTHDRETGELIEKEELVEDVRTVFKLKDYPAVGFVSDAAERFAKEILIPVFGFGDWYDEDGNVLVVKIRVARVSTKKGQTYSFQVV